MEEVDFASAHQTNLGEGDPRVFLRMLATRLYQIHCTGLRNIADLKHYTSRIQNLACL